MINYELYHMDDYIINQWAHCEGDDKRENIIAVGIYYYYYKSEDITHDIFTIDHEYITGEYEKKRIEQSIAINRDDGDFNIIYLNYMQKRDIHDLLW